ncbi:MAG TPA: GNAT family N-acetyltransferase [Synergistales bacterium]|nr:GNAT family N-acetyltransferase [Synergistales bacterium]
MNREVLTIEGDRINLVMLTMEDLLLWLHDPPALTRRMGITNLEEKLNDQMEKVFRSKIDQIFHDRDNIFWYTYFAVVVKDINTTIGLVGFKGTPDRNGWSEIGYGINPAFQNQGYATEMVRILRDWSFRNTSIKAIFAETERINIPSRKVLEKTGFRRIEEDEEMIRWLCEREDEPERDLFRR